MKKFSSMAKPVTTLALGSRPNQGIIRAQAKKEAWDSHLMFLGVQESENEH